MEISLIPDSAPFNPEQRAWLNGFLAGWIGLNGPGASASADGLAAAGNALAAIVQAAPPEPEPEPWHDPALAIGDRLALAEGKPLAGRLMAAMAQLDCGACGYLCRTYSAAIANGAEAKLNLCTPGGSETSKALKRLLKEESPAGAAPATPATAATEASRRAPAKRNGWSRENPYRARVIDTRNLNGAGSEKETRHVEIDLGADGPSYSVGDSLGVVPENCDALVDDLIAALGAAPGLPVTAPDGASVNLREALLAHCCLSEVTDELIALLADAAADPAEAAAVRRLTDDPDPIDGHDVLDLLHRYPSARPPAPAFLAALAPLKPRLYSISSSPKRHSGQVHLTVRKVVYDARGRTRKGVASTMLADRVAPGSPLRVFVQKSHGFTLPADPVAPVIMVGPGTGVAPFRAFLHERDAAGAAGRNWLFYGDQRGGLDFLYESELRDFLDRGVLTRLDTAFSRDGDNKLYVQHRMLERGAALYDWLQSGAYVFVCGDAKRMAADVDRALREVVRTHGRLDDDGARSYVAALTVAGRYRRDVY